MPSVRSGLLVLNKPPRISSREALDCITRLLPRVKMGHAGTLDPMATGVLVVCIGRATRLIQYVQRMRKEYEVTMRLGFCSETHDLESPVEEVLFPSERPPAAGSPAAGRTVDRDRFERCLIHYRGSMMQVPPQHSALRVGGRRAYELARAGRSIELEPRPVIVDQLICTRFNFPDVDLTLVCSSGTYVRAIVRDIGNELGCGAVMTQLNRTRIGPFSIDQALDPRRLNLNDLFRVIRPITDAVQELPAVRMESDCLDDIAHGRSVAAASFSRILPGVECTVLDNSGAMLAIGRFDGGGHTLHPHIVLIGE